MSKIFYEVIMTAVILTLLLTVIALFRNNMGILSASAAKVNDVDKLKAHSLSPLEELKGKTVVKGSDVIAVIRYFSVDSTVKVQLKDSSGSLKKEFAPGSYTPADLNLIHYQVDYSFESDYDPTGHIQFYIYTEQN